MAKIKEAKGSKKQNDEKLFAFIATFLSILGFIIALLTKKENKYVMFYARQSLLIFIVFIVSGVSALIPVVGGFAKAVLSIAGTILWIFSWVYALSGEMKEIPLIGQYQEDIKI
ncbi:MAG: hypothetical protein AABW63_00200 [Nanoarchaeota archaeon]